MPSRRRPVVWLAIKEWRELVASRAWWVMLVATGPIVGVAFTNAVRAYADVSADPGCGIACSPLLGVWAPTFGAFELVAILLLPFVAIRSLSGDRQSGAFAIEMQRPLAMPARVAVKAGVLFAGWLIALAAGLLAVLMWTTYGGGVALPELGVVLLGHALNAALTILVALAIAAATDHPSTAAIVTLALTIGTWMLDFAAAVYGGAWEQLARYTPAAFVSMFQHGLVQTNVLLAAIVFGVGALAMTAVWLRPGVGPRRRALRSAMVATVTTLVVALASIAPGSWDASEGRVNSFSEPEEEALAAFPGLVGVEIHLAPQDPRRAAFERGPLARLRRARGDVRVSYIARTATGLYEQADPGYGEIRYSLGHRIVINRAITDEGLVESLLALADITPPADDDPPYRGRPLSAAPVFAPILFYGLWPAGVAGLWFFTSFGTSFLTFRRHS